MANVGSVTHNQVTVDEEQIVLITLKACRDKGIDFEKLNVTYIRNLAKQHIDSGLSVDLSDKTVFTDDLWLSRRDLLSVCRGLFKPNV